MLDGWLICMLINGKGGYDLCHGPPKPCSNVQCETMMLYWNTCCYCMRDWTHTKTQAEQVQVSRISHGNAEVWIEEDASWPVAADKQRSHTRAHAMMGEPWGWSLRAVPVPNTHTNMAADKKKPEHTTAPRMCSLQQWRVFTPWVELTELPR